MRVALLVMATGALHDGERMASFEIIVGVAPQEPGETRTPFDGSTSDVLDVVVDGERFSAATQPSQAACLLRDLVSAGIAVLEGRTPKALVPLYDAPWELCFVSHGDSLAVSLYRTGPLPEVRLLDRPIRAIDLAQQARAALTAMAPGLSSDFAAELDALVKRLQTAATSPTPWSQRIPDTLVRWRSRGDGRPVRLGLEAVLGGVAGSDGASVRADLHALLFRGRITLEVRGERIEIANGFVFLQLERLLALCRPLLEAYSVRRALHLRIATGQATLAVRLANNGRISLSICRPEGRTLTAAALDPENFVLPVIEAALALAQGIVRCDRTRARNLRLRSLRTEARALRRMVRDLARLQSKVNDDPAPYRASAVPAAPQPTDTGFDLSTATRLRYTERWHAEIEGIDLSGTLLCGDRVIVTGAREVLAIDRRSGTVLWSRCLPRAATTLAGGDILRLSSRGEVELRDVRDGEILWVSKILPRSGATAHAFTVSTTGLPRIVVLAEGERQLVALDLNTGEPRWRYIARHGGAFKIRRLGRLLIVVSGDACITALDVTSGEVVWRFVGGMPFVLAPVVYRDVVIAVGGVPGRGSCRLCVIDAFTGALRWSIDHPATVASIPAGASDIAAVAVTGRDGTYVVGHHLPSGEHRLRVQVSPYGLDGRTIALNAFDDLLVANLPTGRVVGIDAETGTLRWTRVLSPPVADDTPRRLDVQIRAGVLFVPQSTLAVLRPSDGTSVANVEACDLVPDLLRIDEECALYVGEESGHLACYELGPRLSVVRAMS